ncbi:MAG: ribose 5-phosphate isomerase B [Candidatus Limnocylindrales bacterium]
MPIAIGCDEAGFLLKEELKRYLETEGYEVTDYGCYSTDPVDYPDVAVEVASAVAAGRHERAVLICGTGIGMAIAANKVPGVYAANAHDPYSAARARMSNNAQVLSLGARVVGTELAKTLVDVWLKSEFAGGGSLRKVQKIQAAEQRQQQLLRASRRSASGPAASDAKPAASRKERAR